MFQSSLPNGWPLPPRSRKGPVMRISPSLSSVGAAIDVYPVIFLIIGMVTAVALFNLAG